MLVLSSIQFNSNPSTLVPAFALAASDVQVLVPASAGTSMDTYQNQTETEKLVPADAGTSFSDQNQFPDQDQFRFKSTINQDVQPQKRP